jgi:phage pi2 protein 07
MIKKLAVLLVIGTSLSACSTYKNIKLDSQLTPLAQTFLSQNGLADKRQYKYQALSPELQNYIKQNGKIRVQNNNYDSDCGDMFRGIGWLMSAGAFDVKCGGYTNICYESRDGQCTKDYKQQYSENNGGWTNYPAALASDEWSFEDNSDAQFNNSIITSINNMAAEHGRSK